MTKMRTPKVGIDKLLTTREVARLGSVSPRTVSRWIRIGILPATKLNGRTWRVRYGDWVLFLERGGGGLESE